MSVPDDRRVEHQLTEEYIILCEQAEKLLYTAMTQLMPTYSDGKEEHLYLVLHRKNLSLYKSSTSPICATRYATKDIDRVLSVHADSQNPKIHNSLSDSFMNQPVGCFEKKEVKSVDC